MSERDRSHWSPYGVEERTFATSQFGRTITMRTGSVKPVLNQSDNLSFLRTDLEPLIELERSVLFQHSSTERLRTILSAIENDCGKDSRSAAFWGGPATSPIDDSSLGVLSLGVNRWVFSGQRRTRGRWPENSARLTRMA